MTTSMRAWLLAGALAIGCLAIGGVTSRAIADAQCAAKCNAQHDQCLASTNDRYGCDSKRNQCLKSCGGG
jgi:hypothetical protein